jgi:diguanylate cyclase (GGDEF)-like protein
VRVRVVMTTTARLSVRLPLVGVLAAAAVAIGTFVVPAGSGQRLFVDAAQVVFGAVGAYAGIATGGDRRRGRTARRWRMLIGVGLAGWTLTRVWWVVRDLVTPDRPLADVGDAGLLFLPVCLLAALLAGVTAVRRHGPDSSWRDVVVLLIDGVLITGSVLALTWSLVPGRVFRQTEVSAWAFAVAIACPVADLVLITMSALLITMRPMVRPGRVPMRVAGAGLVALFVSDLLRLTHVAGGVMTPIESAGYLIGPVLLAVAVLRPTEPDDASTGVRTEPYSPHLILPYVPVVATGVVIAARTGTGGQLSSFEAYLGWLGLGLVVARQMFTIVDNMVLIARVSEGRQRLQHQAYHDSLTGLANRALLRERLVAALEAYRHRGTPVALLFADLDDFKLINDSFGHAMGDRLLHAIASRLRGCVPADGLVARLGGDEFAVLLTDRAGEAEPIGHGILAALHEPFLIDGQAVGVGASIGLVEPDDVDPAPTADALLRRADAAMYVSKRRGKGNLARYAGGADGGPHADLPYLLARALTGTPATAGFAVYYQPIVRMADGATVAVEALARWTDPVHGPVDPDVFVAVAERTGLVAALDDFVLDRACADASALANTYGRPIDVHVNVSAARLGQPGLTETITRALQRYAVRPSRLVVEITETRRIPDLPRAAAVAARLRGLGVRIALDDFGSGYNALAQLHSLPVDIVKLDATLTDIEIAPDRTDALCRSVLAICAELGISVVAEGIESAAQERTLAGLGCELGQGYLYGQPHGLRDLTLPPNGPTLPNQPRRGNAPIR